MTFDEANDYIRHRVSKTTALGSHGLSRTVPAKIRAHCFFSARVADERVLRKIREVSDAFSAGEISQADARSSLRLWLRGQGQDDGSARIRNLASKARVDLILTQNKRMAVAVGRYAKDRDPAVEERFPCWKYHAGRNPRSSHRKYDGMVFRKDDPIWRKIYPPWEFNCNCWVENTDEEPVKSSVAEKLTPSGPPASGFEFDPSDAFEDYKVDNYRFGQDESGMIVKARGEARQLEKAELKRLYRDVEDRQPGIIEQSDDFWNGLKPEERDLITRYTASDQFEVNKASRGAVGMTNAVAKEMDELSSVLGKAPKYTGGQCYRVINVYDDAQLKELENHLYNSIFGLKGFNSTSVSMEAAKQYANPKADYRIVFHIVRSKSGAFIGQHSWINTDKEVLFDKKVKFRALQPGEKGYIKENLNNDGFRHIAIVEV